MRKGLQIVIACLAALTFGFFVVKIIRKIQLQKRAAQNTATIPQFAFETVAHRGFNKQNIKDTLGNVVIMLFSPDCEHCQYMAQSIVKNKERIKEIQFIMVTPFGDSASVAQFANNYGLNALPNVQLLLDTHDDFPKIFGATLVPSFYVYKNNKLVKSIKGETKVENLLSEP